MEGRGSRGRLDFDPLAFLEAEYAAVLAQGGRRSPVADDGRYESDNNPQSERGDDNKDEDDDDASGSDTPGDCYTFLPSSPYASDGEEEQDASALDHHDEAQSVERDAAAASAPAAAVMDPAKRETIMQSMRQFSLPPPSWVKKANLSDDELVALVQKQLGTAAEQHSAA